MIKISEYAFMVFCVYVVFWTIQRYPKIDRMFTDCRSSGLILHHCYYYIPKISLFCINSLPRRKSNGGKSWRQEHRLDNYIFYCYVLPITTNSISSVHFNLHKYIVKKIEQSDLRSWQSNTSMHGQHRGIDTVHGKSYAITAVWGSGIVKVTSTATLVIITSSL